MKKALTVKDGFIPLCAVCKGSNRVQMAPPEVVLKPGWGWSSTCVSGCASMAEQGCDVMTGTCSCGEFKTVEEEIAANLQRPTTDQVKVCVKREIMTNWGDFEDEVNGRFSEG